MISPSPTDGGTIANGAPGHDRRQVAAAALQVDDHGPVALRAHAQRARCRCSAPVSSSRAPSTSAISEASGDGSPGMNSRRQLRTTSSARSGEPSLNSRPGAERERHLPSLVLDDPRLGEGGADGERTGPPRSASRTAGSRNEALPRSPCLAGSIEAGAPARIVTVSGSAATAGDRGHRPSGRRAHGRRQHGDRRRATAMPPTTTRRRRDGGVTGDAVRSARFHQVASHRRRVRGARRCGGGRA